MRANRKTLAERIDQMRLMVEREELDSGQIGRRMGITHDRVLAIAKRAGIDHLIRKRRGNEIVGGDAYV